MRSFAGRADELALLDEQLRLVRDGRGPNPGRALILSGRRRVGKSRLVQEFCDRSAAPYTFFQATRGRNPDAERAELIDQVAGSSFPGADLIAGTRPLDWNQALRTLATALPADTPSIVVLDEVPWLVEQDAEFEGALQTVWDRYLSARPVLLILVGSQLSVMQSLQEYERPFFGRATWLRVRPLHPADVQSIVELGAAEALDAFLITGGLPELVAAWEPGTSPAEFLRRSLGNPVSPLLVAGELVLLGEFPQPTHARAVLEAIGSGERTFSGIARDAGAGRPITSGTLSPILDELTSRQVVAADLPLSTRPDSKNKRYRVDDAYLRFWLAFLERGIAESERGRGDLVLARITRSWGSWRGRAVEPVVREALSRLLPDASWPETEAIGGWWNRQNNPEIDLVGADRAPVARQVHFVGSIKWLEDQPFRLEDYQRLVRDAAAVPGAGSATRLVAVSRTGFTEGLPLAARWTPEDLLRAWSKSG